MKNPTTTRTTTNKSADAQALDLLTRYLAMRDHSRLELQQKLERRFEPDVVERALSEAETKKWLGTPEDIAARAVLAMQRRKKSRSYIEAQLEKLGLPIPPLDEEAELENARELLVRKFGTVADLSDDDRIKAERYLIYRGFADHLIRTVLK